MGSLGQALGFPESTLRLWEGIITDLTSWSNNSYERYAFILTLIVSCNALRARPFSL